METNILAEPSTKTITLADGKTYTLPPIDLTTLANIEKAMGVGGSKVAAQMTDAPMQTLRLMAYVLLKENHPELTLEQVGHLVPLKQIGQLSQTIAEIMAVLG